MASGNGNGAFESSVAAMMNGLDGFVNTKTVVGEAITYGDTTIIPLVKVSFGMGVGNSSKEKGGIKAGGMGGKISPSSVLVIHDGTTRLINIASHTGIDKLLDMVPDFVDQFTAKRKAKNRSTDEKAVREEAAVAMEETIRAAAEMEEG